MHVHLPPDEPGQNALFDDLVGRMIDAGMRKIIAVNTLPGVSDRWNPTLDQLLDGWERLRKWTFKDPTRRFGMAFLCAPAFAGKPIKDICRRFTGEGAVGFKVTLSSKTGNDVSPEIYTFTEMAAELDVPILFHCYLRPYEMYPGELTPADIAEIAIRVPEAKIILAHAGADYQRALPTYSDIGSISVDISGTRCYEGMVDSIVSWIGADRVLYGSDLYGRGPWSQLAKLDNSRLTAEERRKILFLNAEKLFF